MSEIFTGSAAASNGAADEDIATNEKRRWTLGALSVALATIVAAVLQVLGIAIDNKFVGLSGNEIAGLPADQLEVWASGLSIFITAVLAVLAVLYAGGSKTVLNKIYNVTNQQISADADAAEKVQSEVTRIITLLLANQVSELEERLPPPVVQQLVAALEKFREATRSDLSPLESQLADLSVIVRGLADQDVARVPKAELAFLEQYANSALKGELHDLKLKFGETDQALKLSVTALAASNLKLEEQQRGLDEGGGKLKRMQAILDGVQNLAEQIREIRENEVKSPPTASTAGNGEDSHQSPH